MKTIQKAAMQLAIGITK